MKPRIPPEPHLDKIRMLSVPLEAINIEVEAPSMMQSWKRNKEAEDVIQQVTVVFSLNSRAANKVLH